MYLEILYKVNRDRQSLPKYVLCTCHVRGSVADGKGTRTNVSL